LKKHFKFISLLALLILLISIGVVGCQKAEKYTPNNNLDNDLNKDINDDNYGYNNMDNNNDLNMDWSSRADKIEDEVTSIKNVNDASVLITENTAIIGVDLNEDVKGTLTDDLKDEIKKVVKSTDKDITNVTVTADADLLERIQGIGSDIRKGDPVSGFGDEIKEILRRITPSM